MLFNTLTLFGVWVNNAIGHRLQMAVVIREEEIVVCDLNPLKVVLNRVVFFSILVCCSNY